MQMRTMIALILSIVMVTSSFMPACYTFATDEGSAGAQTKTAKQAEEKETGAAEKPTEAQKTEKPEPKAEEPKAEEPKSEEPTKAPEPTEEKATEATEKPTETPKSEEPEPGDEETKSEELTKTTEGQKDENTSESNTTTGSNGSDKKEPQDQGSDPVKEESDDPLEDKEDDPMPAQSFGGSAGRVSVKASAGKGVFPEGTKMKVTSVSSFYVASLADAATGENLDVVDAAAVDITFIKDGKEIQPAKGSVNVSLSSGGVEGDVQKVVHVTSGGAQIIGGASSGFATFRADHFSIYGIIGGTYEEKVEEKARYFYNFYLNDTDTDPIETQIIADGDSLVEPTTPASEPGRVFEGWYAEGGKVDFGSAINIADTETEDRSIKVVAKFTDTYYVTFYKDEAMTTVLRKKAALDGESVDTTDVRYDFGDGRVITGWMKGSSKVTDGSVKLNGENIDLKPVIEQGYWVTFESNGGSPVAPVYVEINGTLSQPADPTQAGFTFDGWYTDPKLTNEFTFGGKVTGNLTLYAKWKSNRKANYTVVYWQQRVTDDKNAANSAKTYDYAESYTREGTVGQIATPDNKTYAHFKKNSPKTNAANDGVAIKADGTTVYNIYFDRDLMKILFKWTTGNIFNSKEHEESWTGLYQQPISRYNYTWNKNPQKDYSWYRKDGSLMDPISEFEFSVMESGTTLVIEASGKVGDACTIHHYIQNTEGRYELALRDVGKSLNSYQYKNKFIGYEVSGAAKGHNSTKPTKTVKEGNKETNWQNDLAVFYDRKEFSVKFSNISENRSVSRKYLQTLNGADITWLSGNGITPPAALQADGFTRTFDGWYLDDGFQNPVDWNAKMPSNNMQVFAKWNTPDVKVSFDLNGGTCGGSNSVADQIIPAKTNAAEPSGIMEKEGFVFGGWEGADGKLFRFDTLIMKDTALKARWREVPGDREISIAYNVGDKSSSTITDSKLYVDKAESTVAGIPELSKEAKSAGYYFKGWKIGTGDAIVHTGTFIVKASEAVEGTGDNLVLTLTAQYGQKTSTSVTYHANNGTDASRKVSDQVNNGNYTVLSNDVVGFSYTGHSFTGWNTAANGSGETFKPGETAAIGTAGGHLYAVWKNEDREVTVLIKGNVKEEDYDGTEKSVTGYAVTVKDKEGKVLDNEAAAAAVTVTVNKDADKAAGTDAGVYDMNLNSDTVTVETKTGYKLAEKGVTIENGKLTIKQVPVVVEITGNSSSLPYTGEEQIVEGYGFAADNPIYDDSCFTFSGKAEARGTETGAYPMGLTKDQFANINGNFNVEFLVTDGGLEILEEVPGIDEIPEAPEEYSEEPIKPVQEDFVIVDPKVVDNRVVKVYDEAVEPTYDKNSKVVAEATDEEESPEVSEEDKSSEETAEEKDQKGDNAGKGSRDHSAGTGDLSHLELWLIIMVLMFVAGSYIVHKSRKKE